MTAPTVPLGDIPGEPGFVQALVEELHLTKRSNGGLEVRVELDASTRCIVEPRAKRALAESADFEVGRRAGVDWDRFAAAAATGDELTITTPGFPIRHGSAGVLTTVECGLREQVALFFRDIPPIGWNIANGASGSVDELARIEAPLVRELAEELFFRTDDQLLTFATRVGGETAEAAELLCAHHGLALAAQPLTATMQSGPDALVVAIAGRDEIVTHGLHIVLDVPAFGLECARAARVVVPPGAAPLDGELRTGGALLDRPVGLFAVTALAAAVPEPAECFGGGVRVAAPKVPSEDALCPVTRALVGRLFG